MLGLHVGPTDDHQDLVTDFFEAIQYDYNANSFVVAHNVNINTKRNKMIKIKADNQILTQKFLYVGK